jgi:positive regulator of sigma E activity
MLAPLLPFLILLVVALIFQQIPMSEPFRKIGFIVIGVAALILLRHFVHLF